MTINRKPQFIRVKDQLIEVATISEIGINKYGKCWGIDIETTNYPYSISFNSEEECRKGFESVVKQLAKGGYYLS
jgi:hypothetical protein